jgi:AGZA family xanthine/uracil permease-like MFS transporter
MGHNVFFAITVCGATAAGGFGFGWNAALGAVFISGCIFLVLSFFGFREKLLTAIPRSIKNAIAIGIGLLIALVGLEYAGLVVPSPGTHIGLGPIASPAVLLPWRRHHLYDKPGAVKLRVLPTVTGTCEQKKAA